MIIQKQPSLTPGTRVMGSDGKEYIVDANGTPRKPLSAAPSGPALGPAPPPLTPREIASEERANRTLQLAEEKAERDRLEDAQKQADAAKAQETARHSAVLELSNLIGNIDVAAKLAKDPLAVGADAQFIDKVWPFTNTAQGNLGAKLTTVDAGGAFSALNQLKQASSSGASGLGALSESEMNLLKAKVANLDRFQDPDQFRAALADAREYYVSLLRREGIEYDDDAWREKWGIPKVGEDAEKPKKTNTGNETAAARTYEERGGVLLKPGDPFYSEEAWRQYRMPDGTITTLATEPDGDAINVYVGGASPDEDEFIRPQQDVVDEAVGNTDLAGSFAYGIGDTATFGALDELGAGVNAVVGSFKGEGSFGELFNQALVNNRAIQKGLSGRDPIAYTSGQVAGALALPIGASARGARAVGKVGAAEGGAYGFMSGEGAEDRIANAFVGTFGGGLGGYAVGKIGEKVGPKIKNAFAARQQRAVDENQAARDVAQAGQRRDVPVRRYDVDPTVRGQRADILQGGKGRQTIVDADKKDIEALEGAVERDLGGIGDAPDLYASGSTIQRGTEIAWKRKRTRAQRLYDQANAAAADVKIVPKNAIEAIDRNIAELVEIGDVSNRSQIEFLQGLRQDLSREGGLTVAALRGQRTNLRGNISERGLSMTDAERRATQVLDAAADDLGQGLSGEAQRLFREADNLWRDQARFERKFVQQLLGKDGDQSPEEAARRVQQFVKSNFKGIRAMMAELPPQTQQEIRALVASSLGRNTNGEFSIPFLLKHTGQGSASLIDKRTQRLVFGEDGMKAIEDLRLLAQAKKDAATQTNWSNTGGVMKRAKENFQRMMLGMFGITEFGATGGALAYMGGGLLSGLGEKRAARMLTNPDFTKWLKNAPKSANPKAIDAHFDRLNGLVARGSVLAGDAAALQQSLRQAFSQSPQKAAADEGNAGEKPPEQ